MIEGNFVSVIIAAAGMSNRMGSKINKPFLAIGNKPILAYAIEKFENTPYVDEIIVVLREDEIEYGRREIVKKYAYKKVSKLIRGGRERQDSVYNGILALNQNSDIVLTHDGARPFIREETIKEAIEAVLKYDACVVGVKVKDTIKAVNGEDMVHHTPKRSELWQAQTPQCFKKELILRGYELAVKERILATDDSGLVERLGQDIKMIHGTYDNIKITTPEDLIIAQSFRSDWMSKLKKTGQF